MTVNTTKITSGPYVGNGVADTFSYTFRVDDKSELSVYETDDSGNQVTLTVDTDYTVNDVGVDGGGTIVRLAGALPTDYEWYIHSNFEETQLTSFTSLGAFFPGIHERAMDKLTYLIQQILDKLGRTITLSDSYSGNLPLSLEDPESGKVLRWKSDLSGIENFDTDAEYVNISGDTMTQPLAGPYSLTNDDYMPQLQVIETIDDRIASSPILNPDDYIDYGLVSAAINDQFDYGSI